MSSDRPVRTNCYVKGHLGGSNCPQCRAWQQLQPPEQRIAKLEKQLKAATSCFGRYGKIEFDVLESRAEQAEAERDALKARLQQLEGALRKYGRHQLYCEIRYHPSRCLCGFKDVLTPPAAGEDNK